MNAPSPQLSLLAPEEQEEQTRAAPIDVSASSVRLAITLNHREWLTFLADEWWFSTDDPAGVMHLGVGASRGHRLEEGRMAVTVWILADSLPAIDVAARIGGGTWVTVGVRALSPRHDEVIWPGPLPLIAVESFSVATPSERDRLLAMAKGFSNVELPKQPINVAQIAVRPPSEGALLPALRQRPPALWNAFRGAAAMAAWAVPAIDPWLDLLCSSLSSGAPADFAEHVQAPWWGAPPWRAPESKAQTFPLWTAILEIFGRIDVRHGWRPHEILDAIQARVCQITGDSRALEEFVAETRAILQDRQTVDVARGASDPLGLTLQLVLLRPSPERYVSWKDDLPAMPPGVWWTGATLSGFLCGYRDLEPRFRGLAAARWLLALRTWKLSVPEATAVWPDESTGPLRWTVDDERIHLRSTAGPWAERAASNRGRWFRADFSSEDNRSRALDFARRQNPSCVRRCVSVRDASVTYFGDGACTVAPSGHELFIKGQLSFVLGDTAEVVDELEVTTFRDWIAMGSIVGPLPELPRSARPGCLASLPSAPVLARRPAHEGAPPGLQLVNEFITLEEELKLLEVIDNLPWSTGLARRVQHYGWNYDYKARKIDSGSYRGPLPEWASTLAQRLLDDRLMHELPDQVIVNEYVGKQGIAKHIDCANCFRGAIVTISLCESWSMIFRSPSGEKRDLILPRRSAAVMEGASRSEWTHEIPSRTKEATGRRGRRVSVTFRRVDPQATAIKSKRSSSRPSTETV